jgi:antitoxin PrlF
MTSATVSSKGQVTIPVAVRNALGLDTGSRIEFVDNGTGSYSIVAATGPAQALKGMLRKPAAPVSLEQMNQAVAAQAARAR